MKKIRLLAVLAAAVCFSGFGFAEDAASIIKKSTTLTPPDYSHCLLSMDLVDKNGKVQEHREVNQYGNNKNDIVSTVFDIRSPADLRDTRILQAEKKGKTDDKYIFQPQLKTTRRIAAAERQKAWVNSDFTYNDMSIRPAEDDAHEMLDENSSASSNGVTYSCWKIKSVPVANKNVEYAYRIQYVEKTSCLPINIEYFDKTNNLVKTQVIEKFSEVSGVTGKKYWLRQSVRTTNVVSGRSTLVSVLKFEFDKPVSDRYFTQNWLNTGK